MKPASISVSNSASISSSDVRNRKVSAQFVFQTIAAAVKKGMEAEGLNLRQYDGAAGGQTVFHLHFHILPRWGGEMLRRHGDRIEKQDVLKEQAARIRAAF